MESVLRSAARKFSREEHIRNILAGEWSDLYDEDGNRLQGIRGRVGASGMTLEGHEIGADLIEMAPGSAFPLHVHPGDHILCVIENDGFVHVNGVDHHVGEGDTIFIPAEYPHGVKARPDATGAFRFLAIGHPHKHLEATDRMRLVNDDERPPADPE